LGPALDLEVDYGTGVNVDWMYEVFYATTRIARIDAPDRDSAKRRFAAYVLYDECEHVVEDVQLSFGDDAEITPYEGDAPVAGSRDDVRAWIAGRDAEAEAFEVNFFEDPERTLDAYLRLLATNDPWRLEGHGSLGRTLSAVPVFADLTSFDGRIAYRFDATQFLDYIRLDVLASLDPQRPQDSIRIDSLIDVAALHDDALRQIASSYATIATELRLTARYARGPHIERAFEVTFEAETWKRYIAHRIAEPERFLPPPGWTSAFPTYEGG
jgi:hypothetical protein